MEDYSYEGQRCQAIGFLAFVFVMALVLFVEGAAVIIGLIMGIGVTLVGIVIALYIIIKGE